MTIVDNAAGSPQSIALSGAGADFAVSSNQATQSVAPGANATYSVSVAPLGGFNQAVSLTCKDNVQASSCSLSPASVTPNGSAATATLTVTTAATGLPFTQRHETPLSRGRPGPLVWLLAILLGLLSLATLQRRQTWRWAWLALGVMLLVLSLSPACGGGSSGGGGTTPPGTPAGSYTITVTGTAGSLVHNTNLTLTVQ